MPIFKKGPVAPAAREPSDPIGILAAQQSIIQFSSDTYYAMEGEDSEMDIHIVRLGDASREASVDYYTEDSSAKAGDKYEEAYGQIVFKPGEKDQHLTIRILDDDKWNATLEFGIVLCSPHGANLGKYLYQCRVKIIDTDSFPTNKYKAEFEENRYEEIPGAALFYEFVKLALQDPLIKLRTIRCILLDQLKGFYFFLQIWLQLYMIDVVLSYEVSETGGEREEGHHRGEHAAHAEEEAAQEASAGSEGAEVGRLLGRVVARAATSAVARLLHEEPSEGEGGGEGEEEEEAGWFMYHSLFFPNSRRNTAIIVAILYVIPFYIIHYTDYKMVYIPLRGSVRKMLQANLLRKFLNYKEDIRGSLPLTEVQMAMVRDVPEVVDMGYMKVLAGIRILGKLGFCCIFILTESKVAWIPLVVMPVVLLLFLKCREKITMNAVGENAAKQDDVVRAVSDTVKSYRLIADFNMRPVIVDQYEATLENLNDKEAEMLTVLTNNTFVAPLLTFCSIGCYIVYAANAFHTGESISIGLVVTTINVLKEIGGELQEIYLEFIEVQRTFHPLTKIAIFMNLPTDMQDRRRISRRRRQEAAVERRRLRAQMQERPDEAATAPSFAVDSIPIRMENVHFRFSNGEVKMPNRWVLEGLSASFEQGKLYCFVGHPHEGKHTFLKLLGQVFLPEENCGTIFVPPHLRVVHVAQNAFMLHGSLYKNLTLGLGDDMTGGIERVRKVCELVGLHKGLLEYLEEDYWVPDDQMGEEEGPPQEDCTWQSVLTDTAKAKLTMARALIMNPEVLVMQKPVVNFDQEEKKRLVDVLRKHVDERGLVLPSDERRLRRPRTVFFSMSEVSMVPGYLVDKCYSVAAKGLEEITTTKG